MVIDDSGGNALRIAIHVIIFFSPGARCPRGHLLEVSTKPHPSGGDGGGGEWTCANCSKNVESAAAMAATRRLVCFRCKYNLCLVCDSRARTTIGNHDDDDDDDDYGDNDGDGGVFHIAWTSFD